MNPLFLYLLLATGFCHAQGKDVFDTARAGSVDEMKLLVQKNRDTINKLNAAGFSPLILAVYRGNGPVAAYLAKNVSNVNYNSSSGTALAAAAVKGNISLAKALLENGADPNIADAGGLTPLIYAVQFQNKDLVALLLNYKADKKKADAEGKTATDYALVSKNEPIIKLLK